MRSAPAIVSRKSAAQASRSALSSDASVEAAWVLAVVTEVRDAVGGTTVNEVRIGLVAVAVAVVVADGAAAALGATMRWRTMPSLLATMICCPSPWGPPAGKQMS